MPDGPEDDLAADVAAVADQAALGLIRFDSQMRVSAANDAAHRCLARRPGTLAGRSVMETFLDHRLERLVRDATAGSAGEGELGSTEDRAVIVRARPAVDGGAWVSLADVTQLRRLELMRSEFVDNLAHELRTPLASVRLLTELLLADVSSDAYPTRIRERVATIDVETGHLVQMVNELLDLSRIEQAGTDVRQDEVFVEPIATAVAGRLRTFAEQRSVRLTVDISDDLPPMRGDAERLEQLLINLVHNAIKFSQDGGAVTIGAQERGGEIVMWVADTGEGIPVADRGRVFERFYKVDRARQRAVGGTGLGLSVAKHIAEAHGGRIWLESSDGEGSTFSFSIPSAS